MEKKLKSTIGSFSHADALTVAWSLVALEFWDDQLLKKVLVHLGNLVAPSSPTSMLVQHASSSTTATRVSTSMAADRDSQLHQVALSIQIERPKLVEVLLSSSLACYLFHLLHYLTCY